MHLLLPIGREKQNLSLKVVSDRFNYDQINVNESFFFYNYDCTEVLGYEKTNGQIVRMFERPVVQSIHFGDGLRRPVE
jgi:hypothetical protein